MDLVDLNILKFCTALVSFFSFFSLVSSTNAEFYTINNHQIPASKCSSGQSASEPLSAHSQTECILKCKNKAGGENLLPSYSKQKECFCLKDDKQKVNTLCAEKEKGIDGSLFIKVSTVI